MDQIAMHAFQCPLTTWKLGCNVDGIQPVQHHDLGICKASFRAVLVSAVSGSSLLPGTRDSNAKGELVLNSSKFSGFHLAQRRSGRKLINR